MSEGTAVALRAVVPKELGRRIKTARIERRMTQSALAAGVASVAYVSRIESGQRRPDIDVLEGFARNLGVTPQELLFGDATPLSTRIRLELDYAELELATGAALAARDRVTALGAIEDVTLAHAAALLSARVSEALGEDPIPDLRALLDSIGDEVSLWFETETALCRALRESGQVEASIRGGEAALARAQSSGRPATRESIELALTVASAHHVGGDYESALRISRRALTEAESLADTGALVAAYWSASTTQSLAGNMVDALDLADRALEHLDAEADVLTHARLLANVGMFQTRTEPPRLDEALSNLEASSALMETTAATSGDRDRNVLAIAQVHRLAGRYDQALELLDRLGMRGDDVNPHIRAESALARGQVLHAAGRPGAAEAFSTAVLIAASIGVDRSLANLWYEIAATLASAGDAAAAIDAYKRAAIAAGAVPFTQMERSTAPA